MQFGLAFSFPFQDPDWVKKILIRALVSIIPFVGLGWSLDVTKRVIAGEEPTLTEAIDLGGWLKKGVLGTVIEFVYCLPLIIIGGCMGLLMGIIPAILQDSSTAGTVIMIVSLCGSCLLALLGIVLGLVLPAALATYAATDQMGAAFKFGDVFGLLRAAPAAFLIVIVGSIVSGIIGGLGSIACGIGMLATLAYAMAINGHLYAQAYKVAKANLSAAPVTTA
jgi:hypothetical protein